MVSKGKQEKNEAIRWLGRRLRTEALLETLRARDAEARHVTELVPRRKRASAPAPSATSAAVSARGA